jgi:hypothetical protein
MRFSPRENFWITVQNCYRQKAPQRWREIFADSQLQNNNTTFIYRENSPVIMWNYHPATALQ